MKPENINELLGKIRRRSSELVQGDYSRGYKDELIYLKQYIEFYSPEEIVRNLKPIYDELSSIDDEIYLKVSDDLYKMTDEDEIPERNLTGESPRDLMKKEVQNYISGLEFYLKKYALALNTLLKNDNINKDRKTKVNTIKYSKRNSPSGRQNLENLRSSLMNNELIKSISNADFKKIFSGQEEKILVPLDWQGDRNSLKYLLKKLFENDSISGNKRINWTAARNCFLYLGKPIDENFKRNSTKPSNAELIDRILSNL